MFHLNFQQSLDNVIVNLIEKYWWENVIKMIFFTSVFTVQKKCNCTEKFTCGFCLIKCFMLNQLLHKICFKDEWINATSTLKLLDVFLNKIYCDKFICKFIYNSEIKKCEHVVLPKDDVESSSL